MQNERRIMINALDSILWSVQSTRCNRDCIDSSNFRVKLVKILRSYSDKKKNIGNIKIFGKSTLYYRGKHISQSRDDQLFIFQVV